MMEETKRLYFDSQMVDAYLSGDNVYNAPERVIDMISIPGRNGQLAIDMGRYDNISVTYPAFLWADTQTEMRQKIGSIRAMLTSKTGYRRLEDTYHPNEYRMAIYKSGLESEPVCYNRAVMFDLTFDCKPQRFLTAGDTQVTVASGGTITNPTLFVATPLIEVSGNGSLTIGNTIITITGNANNTIFIDSEIMDAYTETGGAIIPANDKVSGEFPILEAGDNGITFTGLTSVKITPRWWTL